MLKICFSDDGSSKGGVEMALLPWDDWFYHLSSEKKEISDLYNEYIHKRDLIAVHGASYNHNLGLYQSLAVYNSALLIAAQQGVFTDAQYAEWLEVNPAVADDDIEGAPAAEALQYATSAAGTWLIGVAVKRMASKTVLPLLKQGWKKATSKGAENAAENAAESGAEDAAEGSVEKAADQLVDDVAESGLKAGIATLENVTEDAAESVAEASSRTAVRAIFETLTLEQVGNLALAGAIFVAVGLDAILGAIDGAKEKHELDAQKSRLREALNKVDDFLSTIDSANSQMQEDIVASMGHFLSIMGILNNIVPVNGYTYDYTPEMKNISNFVAAAQNANTQYGIISKIRNDWHTMKSNNPGLTWSLFEMVEKMQRDQSLSEEQFEEFLHFVADHSDEMSAARDEETATATA